jgi:hypothetical protein
VIVQKSILANPSRNSAGGPISDRLSQPRQRLEQRDPERSVQCAGVPGGQLRVKFGAYQLSFHGGHYECHRRPRT